MTNDLEKIAILTSARLTNRLSDRVDITRFKFNNNGALRKLSQLSKLLYLASKHDAFLVFNASFNDALLACLLKLSTFGRMKIIFFDIILHRPTSIRSKIKQLIKRLCLLAVDQFICNHKDISGYEKYYGIRASKCCYVPFKANNLTRIISCDPKDGGYILSCGASYRDYDLLIEAIRDLHYQTWIVLPDDKSARYHNTCLRPDDIPDGVKIILQDLTQKPLYEYRDEYYAYMANARMVVLPISPYAIQSAGISVYLEAMAMGKAVVITEGVATRGILDQTQAIIVPPGDVNSLRDAIIRAWTNPRYREAIAREGKRYAMSLGGEERLVKDILEAVVAFLESERAKAVQVTKRSTNSL